MSQKHKLVINVFSPDGEDEYGGVEVEADLDMGEVELKHMIAEALTARFGDKVKVLCTFN